MDYSLIVGIHDRDQEDESGISFATPSGADEEELDEEDGNTESFAAAAGEPVCL